MKLPGSFRLLVAAASLLAACNPAAPVVPERRATEPTTSPGPIWPLKVGNSWIGERSVRDSHGEIVLTVPDTISIVGTELRPGSDEIWYRDNRGMLLRNDSLGCHMIEGSDPPVLMAKYPAALYDTSGTSWFTYIDTSGTPAVKSACTFWQVIDADRDIGVPYGAPSCWTYYLSSSLPGGRRPHREIALSPGLGPVFLRRQFVSPTGDVMEEAWALVRAALK